LAEEYQIDKLALDIEIDTSKANVKKVEKLSNTIDKFADVLTDFPSLNELSNAFSSLGSAIGTLSLSNKNISGLSSRLKTLNKNLSKLDTSAFKTKFAEMTEAISPFIDKVSSAQESLKALNNIMNPNITKALDNSQNPKSFSFLSIAKWAGVITAAKRLGRFVSEIAQAGANYSETLNLWETSMSSNLNVATAFVNKMNEAYGVSERTLMNAQAIFKNMLGSLGEISDQIAYKLSEGVTQMALDYASLYNVTFEQAFTKFQAALAGQVRPIRSVSGYDITENTLYQLYQSLGGTKTMRQLSRTEKQLLSILAIFKQMNASGAVGDLDKTMESYANQSRVFAEAWQRVLSYSGVLLTHSIQQSGILYKINGLLIFLGDTLKGIVETSDVLKHYTDPFSAITDGAEDAIKAQEELKGKLLGFDKFNALNTKQDDSVNFEQGLLNAFANFESILNNSKRSYNEFAESLKKASGLFDESGAFDPEKWKELKTNIGLVAFALGGIAIVAGKDLFKFKKTGDDAKKLSDVIKGAFEPKKLGIAALIAALGYMYTTNEDFRESVNNLLKVLFDAIGTILTPILGIISAISPVIETILTNVAEILSPIINIVANVIKFLDKAGLLTSALMAIVGATIAWKLALSFNFTGAIIAGIVALIAMIGALVTMIVNNKDVIWQSLKDFGRNLGNFFANIGISVANGFIALVNLCVDFLNALATPIDAIAGLFGKVAQIPHWDAKVNYNPIPEFADGGLPTKGSLFIAGEAGAELLVNGSNGQSAVMNMQQLELAVTRGMIAGLSTIDLNDDRPIYVNIDGQRFFNASRAIYQRNGYDVSKVR
jgi:hypothetical protein